MNYIIKESKFDNYDTIILENTSTGESVEIALTGATLLRFDVPVEGGSFNIIDGFADGTEMKAARGARSWIMIPFANRIPEGKYDYKGKEYALTPMAPRTSVIHGFASYIDYDVKSKSATDKGAELVLETKEIRPGAHIGYPFSIDIRIIFLLSESRLAITVEAYNKGDEPAPFATGWHPYFRTNEKGIENLVLTLNAEQVVRLDKNYIPLPGEEAYDDIQNHPGLNFNDYIPAEKRTIAGRVLDTCYAGIRKDISGISHCSLYDPDNGLEIILFQEGGVTLAFSGDSLAQRRRMSVALEPMMAVTNAFNRKEYEEKITILPGEVSHFRFGAEVRRH